VKEGLALLKAGVQVQYLHNRVANPSFEKMLPLVSYYKEPDELADKLHYFHDIDLIHVHNEPDWMGHICKQVRPDLPVVFDCHDLFSARIGQSVADEDLAFKKCDAFIYPSYGYQEIAHKFHKDRIGNKPEAVIYSMVNREFVQEQGLPFLDACVYQGGLRTKDEEENVEESLRYYSYRDYRRLFLKLTARNVPLVAFTANYDALDKYSNTGAFMIPPVEYPFLLRELTRFRWGLAGGPVRHTQWDTAMPNKLFEYLAAGIPVIAFNAMEVEEFVKEHGVGVVLEDFRDIPRIYNDSDRYKKVVMEKRWQFTMENQVDKIIQMYNKLL
jgi:glycosyltransferase involved in cell wall biosynthesis